MSNLSQYLPEVSSVIQSAVSSVNLQQPFSMQQPLYELGIDSLATVNLLVELANQADIELVDLIDDIEPPKTVSDLCQVVALLKEMKLCSSPD